ncbi:hypothetical protein [Hymenobacter baengnokdamensis]|uniref:hypothetical protein n=1 Tax=Hymenobacter baengnokdamensis TaxID=2615203 RepID=UPI0012474E13|nr:hypothetical protein [Hymenobacter baengnokdamensis]
MPDVTASQDNILTGIASSYADKGSLPDDYGEAKNIGKLTATSANGNVNNVRNGYFQSVAVLTQR